jgi:hypothetical protein
VKLYENWRDILNRAWSIRLMLLAGVLTACEIVLPMYADAIPRNLFAALSALATMGALVARLVAQKNV